MMEVDLLWLILIGSFPSSLSNYKNPPKNPFLRKYIYIALLAGCVCWAEHSEATKHFFFFFSQRCLSAVEVACKSACVWLVVYSILSACVCWEAKGGKRWNRVYLCCIVAAGVAAAPRYHEADAPFPSHLRHVRMDTLIFLAFNQFCLLGGKP